MISLRHRTTLQADSHIIAEKFSGGTAAMRYFVLDHLGSIAVVMNESGAAVERDAYDAWGKRRNIDGSDAAPAIVGEALAEEDRLGVTVIWMQLGVINEEAAATAREAGLTVIMDRCPKIEYGRLSGEIGWMGVNRKLIDNRKSALFGKGGSLKRPDGKPRRLDKAD